MEENDVMDAETVAAGENEAVETTNEQENEPSSMLEAIQDGLKGEEPEQKPEEPAEKPGGGSGLRAVPV